MKTASTLLQVIALGACLAAQAHGTFEMPGVRRALQMLAPVSVSLIATAGMEAAEGAS